MAIPEHLKETLEHFKQQKLVKMEELRMLELTIRHLQQQVGEQPDAASEVSLPPTPPFTFSPDQKPLGTGQSNGGNYKPRNDEFFSMSIADAARSYLEKVGHAMPVDDILRVITSGGCKVGGADPKRTLSITLGQGKREFILTGTSTYGLRKFYPNIPKLGRPEASAPSKKASSNRGAKKSAKRQTKTKLLGTAKPKFHNPAEVSAAVAETMSDHQSRSADEVLAAVERKVGHPVKKIAVYGTLRKKEFELDGDKYRLRSSQEGEQVVQ